MLIASLLGSLKRYGLEIVLAGLALGFGVWLLLPFDTFGTSATFGTLAELATEAVWGLAMATLGALWYFGILVKWKMLRQLTAGLCMVAWAFISMAFWDSNLSSTASITYPIFSLACMIAYAIIGLNGHERNR